MPNVELRMLISMEANDNDQSGGKEKRGVMIIKIKYYFSQLTKFVKVRDRVPAVIKWRCEVVFIEGSLYNR